MEKRKRLEKSPKTVEKLLDTFAVKRGRGRPQQIVRSWATGRAANYRTQLSQVWLNLSAPLIAARTVEQVVAAFQEHGQPYAGEFVPRMASDILALLRHPAFPTKAKARIGFLADSLGGRPSIAFRTSRDLCLKERAIERSTELAKSPHHICRKEFYVECSCGYEGPARDNACRKCGAPIPIDLPISSWGDPSRF